MNYFQFALRSFFKKGQNNLIKVVSLGTGIAVGFILISKAYFETSYENFYPDSERIYHIRSEWYSSASETSENYSNTFGMIAPGMKEQIPGVEEGTRFRILEEQTFKINNVRKLKGEFIIGDEHLFDVLPRPMISGDPHEVLCRPMYAMISSAIAKKLDGDPIGHIMQLNNYPGREFIIGGVFEEIPENSFYIYDVVLSMGSFKNLLGWDPSNQWFGSDSFRALVKLGEGIDPESLYPEMERMVDRNFPENYIDELGKGIKLHLLPYAKIHTEGPEAKRIILMYPLLALAVLAISIFNYILITLAHAGGTAKLSATLKCYGADKKDISKLIYSQILLHFILSVLFAVAIVVIFQNPLKSILGIGLKSLLNRGTFVLLALISGFIFLLSGVIPARIFSNISISNIFRKVNSVSHKWKSLLLFLQFIGVAFLVTFLAIAIRQYTTMIKVDAGYDYHNIVYYNTTSLSGEEQNALRNLIDSYSGIERTSFGTELFFNVSSGNQVSQPGDFYSLFTVQDLYWIDADFIPLFDINILEGESFRRGRSSESDIIVSRAFADQIEETPYYQDGVIGKQVNLTQHGLRNVVGIYDDIMINASPVNRPTLLSYREHPTDYLFAKLSSMNSDLLQQIDTRVKETFPDKDIDLYVYEDNYIGQYANMRVFRNTVLFGTIAALILALAGLIGYVYMEINHRRSEMAIRKVNGARAQDILKLFTVKIIKLLLPAIILGAVLSRFAAGKWLQSFSVQTPLSFWIFALCLLLIMAIVMSILWINTLKVANRNPVDTLRND